MVMGLRIRIEQVPSLVGTRAFPSNTLARRRNGTETWRRCSCQCEHIRLNTHEKILLICDIPRRNGNVTHNVNQPYVRMAELLCQESCNRRRPHRSTFASIKRRRRQAGLLSAAIGDHGEGELSPRSLTFRHRASTIWDRRFATLQSIFIYLINKYISLSDICLTVHHWYK